MMWNKTQMKTQGCYKLGCQWEDDSKCVSQKGRHLLLLFEVIASKTQGAIRLAGS